MSCKSKASRRSATDLFRDEFESSREWKLRRLFLEANVGSITQDRLVCLSKCFINSAMYGCSYPRAVMKEIETRGCGLLEEYQQEAKEDRKAAAKKIYAVSFVKASDSKLEHKPEPCEKNNNQSDGGSGVQSPAVEIVDVAECQQKGSDIDDNAVGPDPDDLPGIVLTPVHRATPVLPPQKYKMLWASEKHPFIKKLRHLACKTLESTEEFALNKVMNSITKGFGVRVEFKEDKEAAKRLGESYAMQVFLNDCFVVTGLARSKALARKNGMELVLQKLYLPHLRKTEIESGDCEIQASMEPFTTTGNYHKRYMQTPPHSSLNKSGLTLPGKVLISHKDCLPPSLMQFSHKVSQMQILKATLGTVKPAQKDADLESLEYPLIGNYSKISNLAQRQDAFNLPSKKFILVQLSEIEEGPVSILHRSTDFSCMVLDIEHTLHSPASISCEIRLEGQVIGQASSSNTKGAKSEAARRGLEYLGQHCWVLKLKGVDGTNTLSKNELLKEIQQRTDAIGETNLGNKMLRRMGWSGGGVGKHGIGIVEPVSSEGVLGRAGLGLSTLSTPGAEFEERLFRQKVRTALKKYIESEEQEDLRFATEFSKEERKIIHQEASKFHLRTVSRGKQDNRFLTVGHKRSSQQLLQHISDCGGETNSYILLPPGSFQPHCHKAD